MIDEAGHDRDIDGDCWAGCPACQEASMSDESVKAAVRATSAPRPCPLCGREAYATRTVNGTQMFHVGCAACGLELKAAWYRDEDRPTKDILTLWNQRAPITEAATAPPPLDRQTWHGKARELLKDARIATGSQLHLLEMALTERDSLVAEVERLRSLHAAPPRQLVKNPSCLGCGGPHPFDTTVPSVRWNAVIRKAGLPDYLCLTCIVSAFVKAGESFTAELIGEEHLFEPIEVLTRGQRAIDAQALSTENTSLRARIRELEDSALHAATEGARLRELIKEEIRTYDGPNTQYCWWCKADINGACGPIEPHAGTCWRVRAERLLDAHVAAAPVVAEGALRELVELRLRPRIENLVNKGREICAAFESRGGDVSCQHCGYASDVHLLRDLLAALLPARR